MTRVACHITNHNFAEGQQVTVDDAQHLCVQYSYRDGTDLISSDISALGCQLDEKGHVDASRRNYDLLQPAKSSFQSDRSAERKLTSVGRLGKYSPASTL